MSTRWRISSLLLIASLLAMLALTIMPPSPVGAQTCSELVINGGFEADGGWELGVSPVPPQYVTYTSYSGLRSLQLGITSGANVESFSSARQLVTIPSTATQAILSFAYYTIAEAPAGTDYMELVLLSPDGTTVWAKPWQSHNDARLWNVAQFDLSSWRGQSFQLYFNVYNDGLGGKAAMFLDDVSLSACGWPPPGTPSPTATPTPIVPVPSVTPTGTPGCVQLIQNGAFSEGLAYWETVDAPGAAIAVDRFTSAPYSLKLGSLDIPFNGLQTARQQVSLPAAFPVITLDVSIFTQSQPGAGADFQEILLQTTTGTTLFAPYPPSQSNDNAWRNFSFNLSAFAGQTVYLLFGVNNDGTGGRTAMYVDDVRITACSSGPAPTPWPTSIPSWTPVPTWTPWPTAWPTAWPTPWPTPWPTAWPTPPPPAGCVDVIANGSFTDRLAWWTAGKNPLMPSAVPDPVFSPPFAAQMGAVVQNVKSYSSIRQTVSVPFGYGRTFISFWTYTYAESLADDDRQQFVLLGPGNVVWATPWKVLESSEMWEQHIFEVIGLPQQTFDVYFAAINDGVGGRAVLYVDNVHVWACSGGALPMMEEAAPYSALAQDTSIVTGESFNFTVVTPDPATLQGMIVGTPVPFETPVPGESRGIVAFTPMPSELELDLSGVPTPAWTEVSLGGSQGAVGTVAAGAVAQFAGTPFPGERAASPDVLLTQAVTAIETVAPSPSRLPFGLFNRITERWPEQWPWVVGIIVVVFLVILFLIIRGGRNNQSSQ